MISQRRSVRAELVRSASRRLLPSMAWPKVNESGGGVAGLFGATYARGTSKDAGGSLYG